MGAWIETLLYRRFAAVQVVASYMGAWIETEHKHHRSTVQECRILHGCVDWNSYEELKDITIDGRILHGCVDWNRICATIITPIKVASYMGAWIETGEFAANKTLNKSHPTWVRGLKHNVSPKAYTARIRRILHGCVDWNDTMGTIGLSCGRRILHGCVDWNPTQRI